MTSPFDRLVDRRNQGSAKWEMMKEAFGNRAEDGIAVSTADMDFETAPEIASAIQEAAGQLVFGYTVPTSAYFDAVVSWMLRRHGWNITEKQVAIAPGIVSAIYYCLYAFTKPGDGVIIQTPVYQPFFTSVQTSQRTLITNPLACENGRYTIDYADLEKKAALPEAKMMLLCSPHNPVGRDWTYEELERVAAICTKHNVLVISDEIHFDIVFPPYKHTVFTTLPERLTKNSIVCTSPSKSFNIAGLQVSNIVFQEDSMKKRYVESSLACGFYSLNTLAYVACIAAYEKAEPWFEAVLKYVQENDNFVREYVQTHLPEVRITPLEATYLQWLDFSAFGWDASKREELFRQQAGVQFESGLIFGKEGRNFERFNLAYPRSVIREVLQRITDAIRAKKI